jgi:Leu/Phe-tRNA-protein transferase
MLNQNLQESVLFNDSIPFINTSSNDFNIVHKKSVTSIIANNIKKELKIKKFRIAQDKNNLDVDARCAFGLTWSENTIDKAYRNYKKILPDCVIVEA